MLHIVFQEEDVNTLSRYFDLDGSIKGDVFQIKDDYAVGPLSNLHKDEGINARKDWWREVLAGGDYDGLIDDGQVDDPATAVEIKNRLEKNKDLSAWIWIAPNKHDVSGYYWLISQMTEFEGRVEVIWLNNLPFINGKGHIFYPENLFEIPPKEFLKAKKLARPVSSAEFEIDPEEWGKICNEPGVVRILDGQKKLQSHDAAFYDTSLQKFITPDWQRASKVIHHFLSKADQTTGDAYLLWRLKKLIAADAIDAQGDLKNMKDFEVKTKLIAQ